MLDIGHLFTMVCAYVYKFSMASDDYAMPPCLVLSVKHWCPNSSTRLRQWFSTIEREISLRLRGWWWIKTVLVVIGEQMVHVLLVASLIAASSSDNSPRYGCWTWLFASTEAQDWQGMESTCVVHWARANNQSFHPPKQYQASVHYETGIYNETDSSVVFYWKMLGKSPMSRRTHSWTILLNLSWNQLASTLWVHGSKIFEVAYCKGYYSNCHT